MKNIVIIGGGTGTFTLLSGLRKFPTNNSVIVSTADDGGSTGRLRKDLAVLPPGDLRQCLVGLSYTDETTRELFSYRFGSGELKGHVVGNLIIAALQKATGNIEQAIIAVAKILNVRGQVVPVTLFPTTLSAKYSNGKKVVGEHNIDENTFNLKPPISHITLQPSRLANPRALRLIAEADTIVFGPGDLYTSTLPNVLARGMKEAIKKSKARKVMITSLMTKGGQTDGFGASDFVRVMEQYLGRGQIDTVIVNTKKPDRQWLARHKKEGSEFVQADLVALRKKDLKVITHDLLSQNVFEKSSGDSLKRSHLRHDSDRLAKLIVDLA